MSNLKLDGHEGQGRGSKGKRTTYGGRSSGKILHDGGFGGCLTSFMSDTDGSNFWGVLCEESGHNYKHGCCVRCGADEE